MRQVIRWTAVGLLLGSLGLHWGLFQAVAWVSMFAQRIQTESVVEALSATLDGKHPCRMCLLVREGQKVQDRHGLMGGRVVPKFDYWIPADLRKPSPPSATANLDPSVNPVLHERFESPPIPPPRLA